MLFEGSISSLEQLIYPVERDRFIEAYVNQRPLFIHGGSPGRVVDFVTVEEVSRLVQHCVHPNDRIKLYSEGKEIPREDYSTQEARPRIISSVVRRLLSGGASLVVNGIDELHSGIGDLAHVLELELSSDVWANAYVTVGQGGAFGIHFDDHDVLVLQVSGSKRWRLFGRTEEFPLRPGKTLGKPPDVEQQNDVIAPGEVLFVPRGEWHSAETVSSPSLHVTFGIQGVTSLDLITNALKDFRKETLFRKYIPRVGGEHFLRNHEEELKTHLHAWVDCLSVDVFLFLVDSARRNRSQVVLWDQINICNTTKLWVASRRFVSSQLLDVDAGSAIRLADEIYYLTSLELFVLRTAFERVVLSFGELVAQVRESLDKTCDAELRSAVIQLIEHGLLNAGGGRT